VTLTGTGARPSKAIFFWAALGAVFLVTQIYVYSAWIGSTNFRPTSLGADPLPISAQTAVLGYEIISIAMLPFILFWFVHGIVKSRSLDSTRLFMIGWLSAYWLDPWLNFLRPMFTYNAYAFNRGCWCNFIPGWQSANGAHYAEPLLIDVPSYFSTFTFTALVSLWCMRKAKARWQELGAAGLALAGFGGVWPTMGLLDIAATRYLRFDGWPGAFHTLSFWGGQPYQFPIYEFILFPTPFVICAFLLYFTDANGQTAIERGVEAIKGAPWKRTMARVLAFIAFCNVLNLAYTTAMGIHAVYADPWPAHFPSWLADEQCGGKTGIPCIAHE
jgi:Spirocyclase AveC-like